MNLTDDRLNQLNNPDLSPDKRALLRCRIAAELIHTGQYEAAREALGDLWQAVGKHPDLKGLAILTAAEVLLQCGTLSGWLGSVRRVTDAQEKAKDLLIAALRKFESQREQIKVAESKYELGMCYFRLGSYDKGRAILDEAAQGLEDKDKELKAKILIRRTLVEVWTGKYHDAWNILKEAQEFFESCNDAIKGKWHGQMGLVLRRIATAEGQTGFFDRAIIEYTAAAFHFEQAHHERHCGRALNNLAFLLYKIGHYDEAHDNLDRAAAIFARLNDEGALAEVQETRARVLVAEGRHKEANRIIAEVIQVFEKGGEYGLLADAFSTQGVVWAHLRVFDSSIHILRRAMSVAHDSGALSNAGLAALTLIEEHGAERLTESESYTVYRRADEWLKDTQDAEHVARLRACARIVIRRLSVFILKPGDENFSLYSAVEAYEAKLIEDALDSAGGSVTRAAKRLGMSHQSLIQILNTRHQNLLSKRTPVVRRKRPTFKKD